MLNKKKQDYTIIVLEKLKKKEREKQSSLYFLSSTRDIELSDLSQLSRIFERQ